MRPLSSGALSEFTPTLMDDGRILYNRWEYVYKGIAAVQPLWVMRPDGSGGEEFYGDNIANPGVFWQARQVPGHPQLAVCIGCGHEPLGVGQVLLLNLTTRKRTPEPDHSLTPDVKTRTSAASSSCATACGARTSTARSTADPYPLSDKFFLVACNPDGRYNDQAATASTCWTFRQPRPDLSRSGDLVLAADAAAPPPDAARAARPSRQAARRSDASGDRVPQRRVPRLEGVPPGTVKYLRVMEQVPKPWAAEVDQIRGEDRRPTGSADIWRSAGTPHLGRRAARDRAGGSGRLGLFQVPAGRNLFFQALDEDFMEVQRMRTFVNFGRRIALLHRLPRTSRAGPRVADHALATGREPARLALKPGEDRAAPADYPATSSRSSTGTAPAAMTAGPQGGRPICAAS
jgi:hypothetical protein